MALEMHAQASEDDEHGVSILVMRPGIGDMEFPYLFDGFGEEEMDAGETPYRMQVVYRDPEGQIWALQRSEEGEEATGFRIERIEGRTVEGELLPGSYVFSPFEPAIRIEGGRFEIELTRRR